MIASAPSIWTPPALWTPRAGPWWRLPRLDRFMAHLKKGASGHLLKTATGHLAKSCGGGTGCCPSGDEPATMTAVISGVTACTCFFYGGNWHSQVFDINGTYTLTHNLNSADACSWFYVDESVTFTRLWTNSSCNVVSATATGIEIRVQKVVTGSTYTWNGTVRNFGTDIFAAGESSAFKELDVAGTSTCAPASISFTNAHTTCGVEAFPGNVVATGGTMVVTP